MGGLTGIEREKSHQFAGFRTHILVSVGSCITSITSVQLFLQYNGLSTMDPGRLSAQILSGVGFLGAGAILKTSNGIRGLTTAAGIWATACIGIAVGYGYYVISVSAWLIVMITLYILKNIDNKFFKKKNTILEVTIYSMNVISQIYGKLSESQISVKHMEVDYMDENFFRVIFFISYDRKIIMEELIKDLMNSNSVINIEYLL